MTYTLSNNLIILVINMVSKKSMAHIRLSEEDKRLLKELAKKLDISEADVVKLGLKKLAREWGIEVQKNEQ